MYSLYLSTRVVRLAVVAQHKIIEKIADQGSCVIVGRAADYVLRERKTLFRVFIGAPEAYRSDKARAAYYRQISGKRWGAPDQYDLVVDSSCGVEASVAQILKELQTRGLVSRAQPESRPACAAGSRGEDGPR